MLAVGAGGGCLDISSLICRFSFLSRSLWETAQYRLKYCLKGPLSPKQPTNQRASASRCTVKILMHEPAVKVSVKFCLSVDHNYGPLNGIL